MMTDTREIALRECPWGHPLANMTTDHQGKYWVECNTCGASLLVDSSEAEAAGVRVTLAALCLAAGLSEDDAAETELARIWTKVDAIRAKQAAKPKHSPLPAQPHIGDQGELVERLAQALCEADGRDPWQLTYRMIEPGVQEPFGDAWCHYLPQAHAAIAFLSRPISGDHAGLLEACRQRAIVLFQEYARCKCGQLDESEASFMAQVEHFIAEIERAYSSLAAPCPSATKQEQG